MAATQKMPVTAPPDAFEVYNELVRRGRRSWIVNVASLLVTAAALALAFMSFTRPLPVVVASDDPAEPRRIVAAADGATRDIDAKRFFARTAKQLHGWTSIDVVDELTAASLLMTTPWRKRFTSEMNAEVPVPAEVDASGKTTLLRTYVLARIRNELDLDWDTVSCSNTDGVWHCKGVAVMRIQPIDGAPVDDPKFRKILDIRASFVEVPVTTATIDGLLVDFWDAKEKEPS
jgi:hypothetical protein